MIFGGKLASILICQKCKHVSQTYEDFSDLSLSIKQEDYDRVKKRDRFKSLAKRLGAVVSLGTDDPPPRAHSVPPTERPDGFGEQIPPPTGVEEPRRRSLDIPAEDRGQEIDHAVRLNGVPLVVTPDDKHIEFVDQPKVEKKEKTKKEDDGWAKLGRRLSLGLSTKVSKEKERKGRSAERASRDFSYAALGAATSETRSSTSEQNPEIRLSRASHSLERKPESNGPKSRPSSVSSVRILPAVPPITIAAPRPVVAQAVDAVTGVTRSKSPKPPKPSAGETAYLRQILADVSTGGDAVWLKLGNSLPGVEECLRMFTAVEVLDGDNMVGCRRCWKIANGQYVPRVRPPDEDYANSVNEDGDSDDSADNHESPVVAHNVETIRRRPTLPTSLSTPVIYSLSNIKTAESSSSLPLVTPPSSSSDSALGRSRFGDDTDTITPPSSASSVQSLALSLDQEVETPPATKVTIIPPTPNADTFETTGDGERNVGTLGSIVEGVEMPTSSPPLNGIGHSHLPDADALHPPRAHHQRHPSDESTDGSSGDESDVSATSGQISSAAVSEDARSDTEGGASTKSRTKPKKPKPVIMRPAYKRYLIAVPPPVLVIHLKRFQQVSKTMISFSTGFKKLDDYVTFPETLDLTPFLAPKKEDYGLRSKKGTGKGKQPAERCMYRLYAVVVHIGNMVSFIITNSL
jgi:hypothetical protein